MTELSAGRRRVILAICCLSLLIVGMDVTIVNVALYAIHVDLHASLSDLQWTIDAYTLVLASLLMLSGSTADRLGRRRTFQLGLVIFTLGSLLCSVAPSLGWLVAFRMLQAVGGSMLNPVAMSIITNVFTEPRERASAIGVWGATVGVSIGLGPVVGGLLIESVGWRGIFWINVPIGVTAIILTGLFVPESKAPHARRPDIVGQVLVVILLASVTYAVIEAPQRHWISAATLGVLGLAVIALVALVGYERRRFEPLLEMRFFRSVPFSGATLIAVCAFGAFAGFLFLNTLYLQEVRGYSALRAGLFTVPMAVVMSMVAPMSGRLVGTHGARIPLAVAGIAMSAAGLMLVGLGTHTSVGWLILSYVVFALGFGMVNAPITNTAVSGMPRSQAGVAAAVASTSRQVGSALGVAIVGSIVNSGLSGGMLNAQFTAASHPAWWFITGCGLAVLLLGFASSSQRARATATAVAADFGEDENQLQAAPA
jgi:EmrB/QacA subfamily drug resistance transporter